MSCSVTGVLLLEDIPGSGAGQKDIKVIMCGQMSTQSPHMCKPVWPPADPYQGARRSGRIMLGPHLTSLTLTSFKLWQGANLSGINEAWLNVIFSNLENLIIPAGHSDCSTEDWAQIKVRSKKAGHIQSMNTVGWKIYELSKQGYRGGYLYRSNLIFICKPYPSSSLHELVCYISILVFE